MITGEVLDSIIASFTYLLLWSQSTIAVHAWGFELSFFEIWTSNALAFAITSFFLNILDAMDPGENDDDYAFWSDHFNNLD